MTVMGTPAHAKLNVFLRVLGRRDDGYHDIETLLVPISLADRVTVEPADELTLFIEGSAAGELPAGETNLALRAARALAAEAGGAETLGARIAIEKRIPVAAGLGGGSADAAATLLMLDEHWGIGMGRDGLARLAAGIGSDIPALLLGEPAYVRGRGEIVEPVLLQTTTWVVKPFGFGVSSADAYAWWDERAATGPDPGALIAAAEAGNDELLGSALYNDLQGPVAARHPEIAEAVAAFADVGARGAVMSGSGPTVVALCSFASAQDVADAVPGSFVVDAPPRPPTPATIDPDPSGVV
ncbi:MAG TPA: 4-(cytidine 5'-diphospho)-2-C-methyl-D-erythritol kinase [Actinomycetota bacterium]|nr:4-(cytidine 5'-diphospho)-2-C-methyl-D-erythritol kinase [Actinomycetota bacterium]